MYSSLSDRIQSVFDEIEFSESWDHVTFADSKIWLSRVFGIKLFWYLTNCETNESYREHQNDGLWSI